MYYVDTIQAQGKKKKIPVPKKFWLDFPLSSIVKISLLKDPEMFYVDKVQAKGKAQRTIPLPYKFWDEFPVDAKVRVEVIRKGKKKR